MNHPIDEVGAPPEEEAEDLEARLAALEDRRLRLQAEFANYKRRTRQEILQAGAVARADVAGRLVEVIDDLRRVIAAPVDETTVEALHEGVALVARNFDKALAAIGVEAVDPAGERFDPNLHHGLQQLPTDDAELDEVVAQVIRVGYRLGDRELRPAQVIVYRHEEEADEEAEYEAGEAGGEAADETDGEPADETDDGDGA